VCPPLLEGRTVSLSRRDSSSTAKETPPMRQDRIRLACAVAAVFFLAGAAKAAAPGIVSVEKIWDKGGHNAFTDLTRWQGKWYCTFREADGHVGGDGKIRVIESADGK